MVDAAGGFAAHFGELMDLGAVHGHLFQMLVRHHRHDLGKLLVGQFHRLRAGHDLHILGKLDVQIRRQIEFLAGTRAPHLDRLQDDRRCRLGAMRGVFRLRRFRYAAVLLTTVSITVRCRVRRCRRVLGCRIGRHILWQGC